MLENQQLILEMKEIFKKSRQTYGSPRMHEELRRRGWKVSQARVARLMRQAGLKVKPQRRYLPSTTDSDHELAVSPNLLDRNFEPGQIRRAWVSDITYLPTLEGWLYLTTVIDLGDRKVIGWALSETMRTEDTTLPALRMAVAQRKPHKQTLFHSDRGSQYAAKAFRQELKRLNITRQSMSRKGNCWDNAVAESFFKSAKSEWLGKTASCSKKEVQLAVFEYIETWYNTQRRHAALGNKSPRAFFLENCYPKHAA